MHSTRVAALLLGTVGAILVACGGSTPADPPADEPQTSSSSGASDNGGSSGNGGSSSGSTSSSSSSGAPDPRATDGIKNGTETDVDCGGASAPACGDGKGCELAGDCTSSVCTAGVCIAPSHTDGVKNGDETGIDCGGPTAAKCLPGGGCVAAGDCAEGVCTAGACAEPTHDDSVKNGDETGIDCGGPTASPCAPGQACIGDQDCRELVCLTELCVEATALDNVKNGNETDVDCGGPTAPKCNVTQGCLEARDCVEKVCGADNKCAAPRYDDQVKNGDETGTDCGGPNAPNRCPTAEGCAAATDCVHRVCANDVCQAPRFDDQVKNGDETGIDCGGPNAPNRCPTGQGCATAADCVDQVCAGPAANRTCSAPTFTDLVKNGTETDVDCGGAAATAAQRCVFGKVCNAGTDCTTAGCSGNRCTYPSCVTAETAGIATCGTGEVGDPNRTHESCCKSLPLPNRARRLDKYEITAGRMRRFIQAIETQYAGVPNVRQWVATYAAANPGSQLRTLINHAPNTSNLFPAARFGAANIFGHLGMIDMDNYSGIRGCYMGSGSYGSATYWFSSGDLANYGIDPDPGAGVERLISRENLDAKSMSCATPLLLAAFCAWDGGGELALHADYMDAWGVTNYPWGTNVDIGRPNYNWCNGRPNTGGFTCQNTALGTSGMFYRFPFGGLNADERDLSFLIAAPGRFLNDATARTGAGEKWFDLKANLGEYTGDFASSAADGDFCDFSTGPIAGMPTCTRSGKSGTGTRYTGIPYVGIVGDSWEGHQYGRGGTRSFQAMFQYSKFGGRCVHPL